MRYEKPTTVEAATALLAGQGARVLAGGTDLLVQMRSRVLNPAVIVDIKGIEETRRITKEDGGYRIGAAVTGAELKEHPTLSKDWPGLIEAANLIGSTQVQGRATLGGNLCNGSPAADSVPGLIAAGAKASIAGPSGRRELPVEDIMLAPRKLALTPGEFIRRSRSRQPRRRRRTLLPRAEMRCRVARPRNADGWDLHRSGVSLTPSWWPLLVATHRQGAHRTKVDDAALKNLEAAARAACKPIDDKRGTIEFRIDVAGVLARRTALIALERARKA